MFYLDPPGGSTSLRQLESLGTGRLDFLLSLHRRRGNRCAVQELMQTAATTAQHSECLMEGSKKDRVSHFLLRLACGTDRGFSDFFTQMETELFSYRLSCLNKQELFSSLKKLTRFLEEIKCHAHKSNINKELMDITNVLISLTTQFSWWQLVKLYHAKRRDVFITVPFEFVLELVSKRSVALSQGQAAVPCEKIDVVLRGVFRQLLKMSLNQIKQKSCQINQDSRINLICLKLQKQFLASFTKSNCQEPHQLLRCEDIDVRVPVFPLCMSSLHHKLRVKHRLHHHSRIQYTLFLKDIGLPIEEALSFWENEYSQPYSSTSSRKREWECNRKRYMYNIRHLYGMEGGRVNYCSHCCFSLQRRTPGPGEEGGCPFKHYDVHRLQEAMVCAEVPSNHHNVIISLAKTGQFSSACMEYYKALIAGRTMSYDDTSSTKDSRFLKRKLKTEVSTEHDCVKVAKTNSVAECCVKSRSELFEIAPGKVSHEEDAPRLQSSVEVTAGSSEATQYQKEQRIIKSRLLSVTDDQAACYESDLCSCSQTAEKTQSSRDDVIADDLQKPADYFRTYERLLEGLQTTTVKMVSN